MPQGQHTVDDLQQAPIAPVPTGAHTVDDLAPPHVQQGFMSDVADTLHQYWGHIASIPQDISNLVTTDPRKTASAYGEQNAKLAGAAMDAFHRGDYGVGVAHTLNYFLNGIPGVGALLDQAGNKANAGDVKGAIADTAFLATQLLAGAKAPEIVRAATEPGAIPAAATRVAALPGDALAAVRGAATAAGTKLAETTPMHIPFSGPRTFVEVPSVFNRAAVGGFMGELAGRPFGEGNAAGSIGAVGGAVVPVAREAVAGARAALAERAAARAAVEPEVIPLSPLEARLAEIRRAAESQQSPPPTPSSEAGPSTEVPPSPSSPPSPATGKPPTSYEQYAQGTAPEVMDRLKTEADARAKAGQSPPTPPNPATTPEGLKLRRDIASGTFPKSPSYDAMNADQRAIVDRLAEHIENPGGTPPPASSGTAPKLSAEEIAKQLRDEMEKNGSLPEQQANNPNMKTPEEWHKIFADSERTTKKAPDIALMGEQLGWDPKVLRAVADRMDSDPSYKLPAEVIKQIQGARGVEYPNISAQTLREAADSLESRLKSSPTTASAPESPPPKQETPSDQSGMLAAQSPTPIGGASIGDLSSYVSSNESAPGNYVRVDHMKSRMGSNIDAAVIKAMDEGKLVGGRYDGPRQPGNPQWEAWAKDNLITDGQGTYWIGVARPRSSSSVQVSPAKLMK